MRFTSRSNYLHGNPKIISRHAKLRRLKAKGLLPTKAELEQMCRVVTMTGHSDDEQRRAAIGLSSDSAIQVKG